MQNFRIIARVFMIFIAAVLITVLFFGLMPPVRPSGPPPAPQEQPGILATAPPPPVSPVPTTSRTNMSAIPAMGGFTGGSEAGAEPAGAVTSPPAPPVNPTPSVPEFPSFCIPAGLVIGFAVAARCLSRSRNP